MNYKFIVLLCCEDRYLFLGDGNKFIDSANDADIAVYKTRIYSARNNSCPVYLSVRVHLEEGQLDLPF